MNKFGFVLLAALFLTVFCVSDSKAGDCAYWHSSVGVKGVKSGGKEIDIKKSETIIEGMECLLKLEGDKSRGSFSGATNTQVSQSFPQSTVEICALYRISWLFYEKYDHANGIALIYDDYETNPSMNSEESVKIAYESYRKWLAKIREIGLEEARKQKLDPLANSGVRWY